MAYTTLHVRGHLNAGVGKYQDGDFDDSAQYAPC